MLIAKDEYLTSESETVFHESESERLSKLVNTFKYLQPSNKESFEIIDISEVIKDSIKVCELNKKDKNISLTYETFTDSLNIKANKELLKIVFINLIKNAYDSIHIKGDITVRTKLNKKYKLLYDLQFNNI